MSIFDPAKIACNSRIVDAMPAWKKGQPMPEQPKQKLPRVSNERLAYMVKSRPFDHSFNDVVLDLQDARQRIAELEKDAERLRTEMDGLNKRNAQLFDERNEATDLLLKAKQMLEAIAAQRQKAGE